MRSDALARFPLTASDDPAELIGPLRRMYDGDITPMSPLTSGSSYVLRGISAPNYSLGYICSGLGVKVSGSRIAGSYFVNFGISGEIRSARREERVVNSTEVATVFNPGDPQILLPTDVGTETLGIRLSRTLVEDELAALLGRPADGPVRFDFAVNLADPAHAALRVVVESMVDQLDSGHLLFDHPAVQLGQVRAFVAGLLLTHRHNFTVLLDEGRSPLRPRPLRQAMDFIEEHLGEPITIGDLSRAAGCSARTLSDVFNQQFDCSPMAFVRNRRLERVRQDLLHGDDMVGTVATRWGFGHFGRFSAGYEKRFGELPSQTLAHR